MTSTKETKNAKFVSFAHHIENKLLIKFIYKVFDNIVEYMNYAVYLI